MSVGKIDKDIFGLGSLLKEYTGYSESHYAFIVLLADMFQYRIKENRSEHWK